MLCTGEGGSGGLGYRAKCWMEGEQGEVEGTEAEGNRSGLLGGSMAGVVAAQAQGGRPPLCVWHASDRGGVVVRGPWGCYRRVVRVVGGGLGRRVPCTWGG